MAGSTVLRRRAPNIRKRTALISARAFHDANVSQRRSGASWAERHAGKVSVAFRAELQLLLPMRSHNREFRTPTDRLLVRLRYDYSLAPTLISCSCRARLAHGVWILIHYVRLDENAAVA